jgi:hypothetical protein
MVIQGEGRRIEVSPGGARETAAEVKRQAEELVGGGRPPAGGPSSTAAAPAGPVERPAERAEGQRPSAAKPAEEEEAARGMRVSLPLMWARFRA